jgi:hypothetical protein
MAQPQPQQQPAWATGGSTSVATYDPSAVRNRPNTAMGIVPPTQAAVAAQQQQQQPIPQQQPMQQLMPQQQQQMPPPFQPQPFQPQQQQMAAYAEEPIAPNDIRLQPGYAEWYYSQNPRDPRALPPLSGLGRYGFQSQFQNQQFHPARGATPPPGDRTDDQGGQDQTPPNQYSQARRGRAKPSPMNPTTMGPTNPVYGPSMTAIPSPGKPLFAGDLLSPALYGGPGMSPQRVDSQGASGTATPFNLQSYQAAAAAAMAASPYAAAAAQLQMYPLMAGMYGFVPPSPQAQWSAEEPSMLQQQMYQQQQMQMQQQQMQQMQQQQQGGQQQGGVNMGRRGRGRRGGSPGEDGYQQANPYQPSYAQQQEALQRGMYPADDQSGQQQQQQGYGVMDDGQGMMMMHQGRGGRGSHGDAEGRGRGGRGRGGRGASGEGRGGGRGGGGGGAPRQPRSAFLTSFHNAHATGSWTLENIYGHVVELAKDQEGSRFIQRHLEDKGGNSDEATNAIFNEVLEEPMSLMTDVFGNYVVQKMLDVATPEQLSKMAQKFRGHVLELTLHTFGCRVVQRAIQVFNKEGFKVILDELRNHVAHCVQDQNGNHVIQKAIEQWPTETDFVIEAFLGRVPEFATHAYGCRVIQCIFAHSPNRQEAVLEEIVTHCDQLTKDQFGNYVVQHILETNDTDAAIQRIIETLTPKFIPYSTHKFASNVMEKVYLRSDPKQRRAILEELIKKTGGPDGASPMLALMKDQFGNYVVQRMIDHSNEEEKQLMVEHIKPHVHELRRVTFGKHIIARLERNATLPAGAAKAATPNEG